MLWEMNMTNIVLIPKCHNIIDILQFHAIMSMQLYVLSYLQNSCE